MSKLPQVMINVEVPDPAATMECKAFQSEITKKGDSLADRGRVLVRPSGTEPLLRVMVEGEDADEVRVVANELALFAENQR